MDGRYWKGDRTMSTNEWLLASDFDSFLNLDMGDDTNTKLLLLHVQTTYMTSKMRGDCWGTWLIMLGFMDLGWPRVCRRPTSVLFFFFSCDQAALQMVFSVRLSVRLSHLFDYVPIIVSSWNFQELLPMNKVRSMQKIKVRGQRSRSQRSQPNLTVSGL